MTKAEIRDAVRRWVMERPEATNELIDSVIHKVYISMATPFRFHELETSKVIDIVDGTGIYPLTTAEMYAVERVWNGYDGRWLDAGTIRDYQPRLDYDHTGSPATFVRHGQSLYVWPTPNFDAVGGLTVYGLSLPAPLVSDTDEPVYPEDWHWVIEMGVASIVSFMLNMDERGQLLQNISMGQMAGRQEAHTIEKFFRSLGVEVGRRRHTRGDVEIRG